MNSIHLNPEIMTLPLNRVLRIHTLSYLLPEKLHVPHTCELHVPEKSIDEYLDVRKWWEEEGEHISMTLQ